MSESGFNWLINDKSKLKLKKYSLEVVYGTHPIPQKYLDMHDKLGTWDEQKWQEIIAIFIVGSCRKEIGST